MSAYAKVGRDVTIAGGDPDDLETVGTTVKPLPVAQYSGSNWDGLRVLLADQNKILRRIELQLSLITGVDLTGVNQREDL